MSERSFRVQLKRVPRQGGVARPDDVPVTQGRLSSARDPKPGPAKDPVPASAGAEGTSPADVTGPDLVAAARLGAAAAAAALALTSTGTMFVAAALVAFALAERLRAAAVLLAVVAVAVRFGTVSFEEVAGIQSVLGAAVRFGPATAAASAVAAAVAVLLATRAVVATAVPAVVGQVVPALATGALAAAIATGPGPGGDLWIRVAGTVVGVVIAWSLVVGEVHWEHRGRHRPAPDEIDDGAGGAGWSFASARVSAAAVVGLVAVVLAGWPT